jgi:radical SAM superfamily enzyme YgiQ (UPF0313 family)
MKITFVYTDYGLFNQNTFNRGVAILSSCLKRVGFKTSLIHIYRPIDKKGFLRLVKKHNPDLIAFSFITNMFAQIKKFSLWVKELGIPSLHGGMHPTVAPQDCLSEEGINALCRGEGEGAIVDFTQALESKGEIKNIPNIWSKEDSQIYQNPCRDLIEDLDSLPYPDYEIFEYENLEEGRIHKILVTQASRGCLYNCTYCCNPLLRSLYPNKGKFLRYYSVGRLLDEIEWGLKIYPFLKEVRFTDDTLTQDKKWFKEFALKYKERIGLPYSSNERVENIDLETAQDLKMSGCTALDLGIESGDKLMREKYMNRRMSDEKIREVFSILRSCGIRANSFNVLGMIGETPQTILATVKLNARVRPSIVFNAYFYPFKGTQAYNFVQERKYPVKEAVSSFFERPVVTLDTITPAQLVFFYKYFYFLMRVYRILWSRFIEEGRAVKTVDRIITSKYFPYAVFNFLHVGKEDILIFLRRNPRLYLFLRRIYRLIKSRA